MWESALRLKPRTNFLKLSIQRRPMEWESGCRSAARSSRDIRAVSGPSRMPAQVQRSRFPFLAVQGTRRTCRCSEERPRSHAPLTLLGLVYQCASCSEAFLGLETTREANHDIRSSCSTLGWCDEICLSNVANSK